MITQIIVFISLSALLSITTYAVARPISKSTQEQHEPAGFEEDTL